MNDPAPTGVASSILGPGENSVGDAVDGGSGQKTTPRKFLAKRTPRPKPQFPSAALSGQTRLQTPHASRPGDEGTPALLTDLSHPLHRQTPPGLHCVASVRSNTCEDEQIQAKTSLSPSRLFSVQQRSESINVDGGLVIHSPQQFRLKNWESFLHDLPSSSDDPRGLHDLQAQKRSDRPGSKRAAVIDLTQEGDFTADPSASSGAPPVSVASEQNDVPSFYDGRTRSLLSRPISAGNPLVDSTGVRAVSMTSDQSAKTKFSNEESHVPRRKRLNSGLGWLRVSTTSPDLPATLATRRVVSRTSSASREPDTDAIHGSTNSPLNDVADGAARVDDESHATESSVADGASSEDQDMEALVGSHAKAVQDAFSKTVESGENSQCPRDEWDLDSAIYGQPGAALPPPPGVQVRRLRQHRTSGPDEERMYIHANPAIQLMHNRSDTWYARKNSEIQRRPGRKYWFGNVSGRLRWLRDNQAVPQKRQRREVIRVSKLPRCPDPKPRVHSRALDFGDIPEKDLPDYVQENEVWLEACEFFRQAHEARGGRARTSKSSEEELPEFSESVIHVITCDSD